LAAGRGEDFPPAAGQTRFSRASAPGGHFSLIAPAASKDIQNGPEIWEMVEIQSQKMPSCGCIYQNTFDKDYKLSQH
jgi:hypothetical protein